MCSPVYTGSLVLVKRSSLIPARLARGYTRVSTLHRPRTLATAIGMMRVFVRETLVENIIANVIPFTLVADDREGVRQSLRSRKQGGHHFRTARGLMTSRSQSPGLAGLGGGGRI